MRYLLLVFFILTLGTACRKNDTDSATGSPADTTTHLPTGNRIDSVATRKVADSTFVLRENYKYDANGNLAQYLVNNIVSANLGYDTQNRITLVSNYGSNGGLSIIDTLVYTTNDRLIRGYRVPAGSNTLALSRAYVFDSRHRLILDTLYFLTSLTPEAYFTRYTYDTADNLQSSVLYWFDRNNVANNIRQDSLVYTCDNNENPYYKYAFAIRVTSNQGFPLCRHNVVSQSRFNGTATQPNLINTYPATYYSNGLLRTQVTTYSTSSSANTIKQFFYR